jgi:acyl-[acyl-carrier-protein]-phospholipid O-acyltransferase/long-chain-fatty-acid--[acyl-carrier-protein] ligase
MRDAPSSPQAPALPAAKPSLLVSRRFLPLFVVQFLGATNDNLFKNAIAILTVYRLLAGEPARAHLLVSAAAGLFILPYVLFSSLAGELADRAEKAGLVRLIKLAEIAIMALGSAALFVGDPYALLGVLFLLGLHSTFFGPIKYAILPQHLGAHELVAGNALVEGGTFLAILIGTIVGGLVILIEGGRGIVSVLMLAIAAGGFAASLFLPRAPANQPGLAIDWNLVRGTRNILRAVGDRRDVKRAVIGIAWFWGAGAAYLGQLPSFAHDVLAADEQTVTAMLAMFSVGIGAGAALCGRLLKGEVSARLVPLAALGMALFTLDLAVSGGIAARPDGVASGAEIGIGAFAATLAGLHVLLDLFLIAVCGGLFTVPLYTIMQAKSDPHERARVVAGGNIVNAAAIVAGTVAVLVLVKLGVGALGIFAATALGNAAIGLVALRLVPDAVPRGWRKRPQRETEP